MGEILEVIKNNVKKNAKKLAGILGDIVSSVFVVSLFAVQGQVTLVTGLAMILFAVKPFVYTYITLVFKNESENLIIENDLLKQQLAYVREIAEYRVQIAAKNGRIPETILENETWNEANAKLKELEASKVVKS